MGYLKNHRTNYLLYLFECIFHAASKYWDEKLIYYFKKKFDIFYLLSDRV